MCHLQGDWEGGVPQSLTIFLLLDIMQFNSLEAVESTIVQGMAKKSQCGMLGNIIL